MTSSKRVLAIAGLIILAGGAGYGIYRWQASPRAVTAATQSDGARQRAVPVVVATATRQPVPSEITAIGQVTPWQSVSVKSRIDGLIVAVNFKPGDEVKAGQTLFKLDDRQLNAQMHQAQATLASDRAKLANAQSDLERAINLGQYATRQAVDTQKTLVMQLQASIQGDQAQIDNLQVQLSYTDMKAPIDGRAGDVLLTVGNNVKANDTNAMVTINQLHPIAVQFGVPQRYFPMVRQVMTAGTAEATAEPPAGSGKPIAGKLSFLDNAIDSATGTFQVKGAFANDDGTLWPGMFVSVTIRLGTDQNALVVPNAAVMTGQQGSYAYVVKPDMTVEARPLQVARATSTVTVIDGGLQPGDQVVIEGQLRVTNGTKIEIRKPDGSAPDKAVAGEARPEKNQTAAAPKANGSAAE
jgi:multidrug efflux system membrane fusion protein